MSARSQAKATSIDTATGSRVAHVSSRRSRTSPGRTCRTRRSWAVGSAPGSSTPRSSATTSTAPGPDGPEAIASGPSGPGAVEVVALLRGVDEPGADPTAQLRRVRQVRPGEVRERLELTCATREPVAVSIEVAFACDLADMKQVRHGRRVAALPARTVGTDGVAWCDDAGTSVILRGPDAQLDAGDPRAPRLSWRAMVLPGSATVLEWEVLAAAATGVVGPP